ncbi:MAG TPA: DUF3820 family protein [Treponemataceae bacterium]|jgi:hypothetical protein|nr:MAG: hypothetical protein BWY39_01463 [Spirochaetes bacterium ADurb.Bin269]TAH55248.1 MAG: hypothetical protein EWM51_03435 [Treponema sp.]HOC28692.1 DUF3820 family protein [Treponemataceae bacterium]HPX46597.1 DUF3820 family protein [Treponemataceae bacterium]HQL32386.1 DUF3820 family protein [Treponemataceae bacterium]
MSGTSDHNSVNGGLTEEQQSLLDLAQARMPFGKYAGMRLFELPETYVLWFKNKGYPEGKLGNQLRAIEEIKTNGLEYLLRDLVDAQPRFGS